MSPRTSIFGKAPRAWGSVVAFVALLPVLTFPAGPAACCPAGPSAADVAAMSCCAEEPSVQRSACPSPADASEAPFLLAGKGEPIRAIVAPSGAPAIAGERLRISAPTHFRLGHPPESPPLYSLHSQLLI